MNTWNGWARLATAAGSLLWVSAAVGQGGLGGTSVGGPSNGYAGADQPAATRQNTPSTGGGPTSQTSRSTRDETASSSASGDTSAMSHAMTGKISKLDADERTIELQGDRKLKVDASTEIRRDGQRASFSDLHEGDDVRASFAGDDRTTVKRIDVMPGSGSASSDTSSTGSSSMGTSSRGKSSTDSSSSYGGAAGSASGTSGTTTPPSSKPSGQ